MRGFFIHKIKSIWHWMKLGNILTSFTPLTELYFCFLKPAWSVWTWKKFWLIVWSTVRWAGWKGGYESQQVEGRKRLEEERNWHEGEDNASEEQLTMRMEVQERLDTRQWVYMKKSSVQKVRSCSQSWLSERWQNKKRKGEREMWGGGNSG